MRRLAVEDERWSSNWRLTARLALVITAAYFTVDLAVEKGLPELPIAAELAVEGLLLGSISGLLGWFSLISPLRRVAAREIGRQQFEQRLHRGLEMVDTEAECHEVTQAALEELAPGVAVELLLADSSEAHLKQVLPARSSEHASCGVVAPHACPAIRRGQIQVFDDRTALDTCPHLKRSGSAMTAVCAPLNVVGRSIGVLHLPDVRGSLDHGALDAAASQTGARLGLLRVMARAHLQAATDPLTGLLNRRSLEDEASALLQRGTEFTVAFGDLDHFKQLNDVHGHDTGDRALRLFARTLAGMVRATDSVARYGGEEFVVLLPEVSGEQAVDALHGVQVELAAVIGRAGLPAFTVSFGVAHSTQADDLVGVLRLADASLLAAKRAGRNQVVLEPAAA